MRRFPSAALAAGFAAGLVAAPAAADSFRLLGEFQLPTGLKVDGVAFGGLSAIDYDPVADVYYALSDDRAERGPARIYRLKIDVTEDGFSGVDIAGRIDLTDASGAGFAPKSVDPEALRLAEDGFFWAHEGDAGAPPFVGTMDATGRSGSAFPLPGYYVPRDGDEMGVRRNRGFESLTRLGDAVVVALENALAQDGPAPTLAEGSPARVLVYRPDANGALTPSAEYVYETDPIAREPSPSDGYADNGLVELLADRDGALYALERSFSVGRGVTIKLFKTGFDGADDVLNDEALSGPRPMPKELLMTLQPGGLVEHVDNIEGMTFGPTLDGQRTLVMVSDNNFNPNGQLTQILVFVREDAAE